MVSAQMSSPKILTRSKLAIQKSHQNQVKNMLIRTSSQKEQKTKDRVDEHVKLSDQEYNYFPEKHGDNLWKRVSNTSTIL